MGRKACWSTSAWVTSSTATCPTGISRGYHGQVTHHFPSSSTLASTLPSAPRERACVLQIRRPSHYSNGVFSPSQKTAAVTATPAISASLAASLVVAGDGEGNALRRSRYRRCHPQAAPARVGVAATERMGGGRGGE